jgi:hypothetical protein
VLFEWRRGRGFPGCRDQIGDGAALHPALPMRHMPQLIVETGRLEVEVESDDALAERSQEARRVREQQRAPHAAFVGIEGERFHGGQAARPKAPPS